MLEINTTTFLSVKETTGNKWNASSSKTWGKILKNIPDLTSPNHMFYLLIIIFREVLCFCLQPVLRNLCRHFHVIVTWRESLLLLHFRLQLLYQMPGPNSSICLAYLIWYNDFCSAKTLIDGWFSWNHSHIVLAKPKVTIFEEVQEIFSA